MFVYLFGPVWSQLRHAGSFERHTDSLAVAVGSVVVLFRLCCSMACGILVP